MGAHHCASRGRGPARAGIFMLATLAGCAAPREGAPPPSTLSLYLQGRVARESGDLGRARTLFLAAEAAAPADRESAAWFAAAIGELEAATVAFGPARVAFERALAADPDSRAATLGLVRLELHDQRPDRALTRLLDRIRRHPDERESLELLHPLLLYSGAIERGLELFTLAAERSPENAHYEEAHGDFLACSDREEEALASYRRALALDPRRVGVEIKAARLLEKQADRVLRRVAPTADPRFGKPAAPDAAARSD